MFESAFEVYRVGSAECIKPSTAKHGRRLFSSATPSTRHRHPTLSYEVFGKANVYDFDEGLVVLYTSRVIGSNAS